MKVDYDQSEKFKTNILNFALNCDFNLGPNWYIDRRKQLIQWLVNEKISLPYPIFAGIVSILSPGNKWENNLNDAKTLVLRYYGRTNDRTYKYYTYNHNVIKASKLLGEYDYLSSKVDPFKFGLSYFGKSGLKTMNFYKNLVYPNEPNFTLDRHMIKILGLNVVEGVTPKQYSYFGSLYTEVWNTLKKDGIFNGSLSSFQAVLWCNYVYNIYGIKH